MYCSVCDTPITYTCNAQLCLSRIYYTTFQISQSYIYFDLLFKLLKKNKGRIKHLFLFSEEEEQ